MSAPSPSRPPPHARPTAGGAVFLARRSYRRRRLADAARALPVLGAFLFLLPVLGAPRGAAATLTLLFAAWGALIVAAALLARGLAAPEPPRHAGDEPRDQPGDEPGDER